MTSGNSAFWRRFGWIVLILLAAAFLRLHAISEIPPGMTHDEADHGWDAWRVVNGARPIFFTVANGREPLFDYSTAGLMRILGATFLAGRLTAVYFSLLAIAGIYSWSALAFDRQTAALTAAGLAVSFWGTMSGRQALRSVALSVFICLAALWYWRYLKNKRWQTAAIAGIWLGASFYVYLPARILWVTYVGLLIWLAVINRAQFRQYWLGTALTLGLAGLLGLPLFAYLRQNPGAEARIGQLTDAVEAATEGDFSPLGENIAAGLRLITIEGDSLWRYNVPGKPLLEGGFGWLFYAGILLALWQAVRKKGDMSSAAAVFAVGWLLAGLSPALITGADHAMQRTIGMQPILYLFPALSLAAIWRWMSQRWGAKGSLAAVAGSIFLMGITGIQTYRDYFWEWGVHPQTRVQYESALTASLKYINGREGGAAAISSQTPNLYHSPSLGLLYSTRPTDTLRWFNGTGGLLIPAEKDATMIFSGLAPLAPELQPYFAGIQSTFALPLPATDLDQPVTIYQIDTDVLRASWSGRFSPIEAGNLDGFVTLKGAHLSAPVQAGETLLVTTLWQIQRAHPDLILFTHLTNPEGGAPLAQADRLDAPSYFWQNGDWYIQLHQLQLPADLPAGSYELIVGAYSQESGERLHLIVNNQQLNDTIPVGNVTVGGR